MPEPTHTPLPLDTPPDNQTVQQCCICYGGSSFSGPMKDALECHLSILKSRFPELAAVPELVELLKRSRKGFLYIAKELGDGGGLEDIISEIEAALAKAGEKLT